MKIAAFFLSVSFLLFLLLTPKAAYAADSCQTINLVSGESSQSYGFTESNLTNDADALTPSNYQPGVLNPAAVIIPHPAWVNPATDPDYSGSGALWISDTLINEALPSNYQWRLFEHGFSIPAGQEVIFADVWYSADNAASVFSNGTFAGTTGGVYGSDGIAHYASAYHATFTPSIGENKLNFVLSNWGSPFGANPTGLLYKATVTYCSVQPASKDQCKKNGWKEFSDPAFKNQGDCVSFVNHL